MRTNPNRIIKRFKEKGGHLEETVKELGISRATLYRWIGKARSWGGYLVHTGLKRKSTRPKRIKKALRPEEEAQVLVERKRSGYSAAKIKKMLSLPPAPITIHRFLKQRNLLRPYGYHRRPRFQETNHMQVKNTKTIGYLQMDVKYVTPELSGLEWTCFEYAAIDIFSRYKQALLLPQLDQDQAILALFSILKLLPFEPVFLQTDNGLEFQERFREFCLSRGLAYHYIHKSTPNENAVIERSFRTDEDEFFFWQLKEKPRDLTHLNDLFQEYLYEYNYRRPHLGINLKTPSEAVSNVMIG